ncbi:hypothetical protein PV325_005454 [Microctonus aethiopoides]|nr:hypothetical protein PV325_005454 [Microctonus aethiopoides]
MMLQTVPRVPVAGIKRRWGGRIAGLQESSPEVTSSGVLSSPPHYHPATPESTIKNDDLQLWDLDLHRGLQDRTNGSNHLPAASTILPINESISPTAMEGSKEK